MNWKHHGCAFDNSGALPQRHGAFNVTEICLAGKAESGTFWVDNQVATATKSSEESRWTMSLMQSGAAAFL